MHLKPWRSQIVLQRSQGVDQWVVGWLKASGRLHETCCEEKFCRSQDCPSKRTWRNLEGFEGLWRSHQPFVRSFFPASLRVRVAGSIKRIMLTTPMKPLQSLPPGVSKFQQERRHENPRKMVIWCDELAQKLLENRAVHIYEFCNSSCRNKPTCTCSGNSLRYGLPLDVAFRELSVIKESYSLLYRTGNMASPKGTKWWPSMALLQIGMCQKLQT